MASAVMASLSTSQNKTSFNGNIPISQNPSSRQNSQQQQSSPIVLLHHQQRRHNHNTTNTINNNNNENNNSIKQHPLISRQHDKSTLLADSFTNPISNRMNAAEPTPSSSSTTASDAPNPMPIKKSAAEISSSLLSSSYEDRFISSSVIHGISNHSGFSGALPAPSKLLQDVIRAANATNNPTLHGTTTISSANNADSEKPHSHLVGVNSNKTSASHSVSFPVSQTSDISMQSALENRKKDEHEAGVMSSQKRLQQTLFNASEVVANNESSIGVNSATRISSHPTQSMLTSTSAGIVGASAASNSAATIVYTVGKKLDRRHPHMGSAASSLSTSTTFLNSLLSNYDQGLHMRLSSTAIAEKLVRNYINNKNSVMVSSSSTPLPAERPPSSSAQKQNDASESERKDSILLSSSSSSSLSSNPSNNNPSRPQSSLPNQPVANNGSSPKQGTPISRRQQSARRISSSKTVPIYGEKASLSRKILSHHGNSDGTNSPPPSIITSSSSSNTPNAIPSNDTSIKTDSGSEHSATVLQNMNDMKLMNMVSFEPNLIPHLSEASSSVLQAPKMSVDGDKPLCTTDSSVMPNGNNFRNDLSSTSTGPNEHASSLSSILSSSRNIAQSNNGTTEKSMVPTNAAGMEINSIISNSDPDTSHDIAPPPNLEKQNDLEPKTSAPSSASNRRDQKTITIRVFDEARNVKKDFVCKKSVLLKEMKYFSAYLSDKRGGDPVGIDVHCDIEVFEWLTNYMATKSNAVGKTSMHLEPRLVVSILISSDFLQMSSLVRECLDYCYRHLNEIVKVPLDMSCIHAGLLKRMAALFSLDELELVKDRKDKILSKLYQQKIGNILDDPKRSLVSCVRCGHVFPRALRHLLPCYKGPVSIDFQGDFISLHEIDESFSVTRFLSFLKSEGLTWKDVFWRVWGVSHVFYCVSCKSHFTAAEMEKCPFHPSAATFGLNGIGKYSCCGKTTSKFDAFRLFSGCAMRDHCPDISPIVDQGTDPISSHPAFGTVSKNASTSATTFSSSFTPQAASNLNHHHSRVDFNSETESAKVEVDFMSDQSKGQSKTAPKSAGERDSALETLFKKIKCVKSPSNGWSCTAIRGNTPVRKGDGIQNGNGSDDFSSVLTSNSSITASVSPTTAAALSEPVERAFHPFGSGPLHHRERSTGSLSLKLSGALLARARLNLHAMPSKKQRMWTSDLQREEDCANMESLTRAFDLRRRDPKNENNRASSTTSSSRKKSAQ